MSKLPPFGARILGYGVCLAAGVASYFWATSETLAVSFLISLCLILLGLLIEVLVKLSQVDRKTIDSISDIRMERDALAIKTDDQFLEKYRFLRRELKLLLEDKVYHIHTLDEVYEDDLRSIRGLTEGEPLFSTCPMATDIEDIISQIGKRSYEASTQEHILAVKRGVEVTRIYLFRSRPLFATPEIRDHLSGLANSGLKIRVLFRTEEQIQAKHDDFLIFGETKVSVGSLGGIGVVISADVYYGPEVVKLYRRYSDELIMKSHPIETL